MFGSDFVFNPTTMMGITAKVVIILTIAIVFNIIQKKIIPRAIIAATPKVLEESQDQLAIRTKTMAYVVIKVVSAITWIGSLFDLHASRINIYG